MMGSPFHFICVIVLYVIISTSALAQEKPTVITIDGKEIQLPEKWQVNSVKTDSAGIEIIAIGTIVTTKTETDRGFDGDFIFNVTFGIADISKDESLLKQQIAVYKGIIGSSTREEDQDNITVLREAEGGQLSVHLDIKTKLCRDITIGDGGRMSTIYDRLVIVDQGIQRDVAAYRMQVQRLIRCKTKVIIVTNSSKWNAYKYSIGISEGYLTRHRDEIGLLIYPVQKVADDLTQRVIEKLDGK